MKFKAGRYMQINATLVAERLGLSKKKKKAKIEAQQGDQNQEKISCFSLYEMLNLVHVSLTDELKSNTL